MDQDALNEVWRHMHEGLTLASQSPIYERFPVVAARVKREAKEFAAQPPPRSVEEITKRRAISSRLIESWGASLKRCEDE